MHKITIPMLAVGGFVWLAQHSLDQHGYTQAEIEAVNDLIPYSAQERADAIADMWGIDRAQPVELVMDEGVVP